MCLSNKLVHKNKHSEGFGVTNELCISRLFRKSVVRVSDESPAVLKIKFLQAIFHGDALKYATTTSFQVLK
jgi:Uri superfamily endonuclease